MFHQVKSFKVKLGLLGPKLAFRFKIDTRGNKETTAGIKKKSWCNPQENDARKPASYNCVFYRKNIIYDWMSNNC